MAKPAGKRRDQEKNAAESAAVSSDMTEDLQKLTELWGKLPAKMMAHSQAALDLVEGMAIELRGGRVLRLPSMPVGQVVELVRAIEAAS